MTRKQCEEMRKQILQQHESELKNLKPCPLCGGKDFEISFDGVDKESKLVNISCKNEICRKNGFGHIGTIETVINAWNKYAEQTPQQIAEEKELWKDYVEHP